MRHLMLAEDHDDLSRRTADWIIDYVRGRTGPVTIAWSTDATLRGTAAWLSRLADSGAFDPQQLRVIQTDELLGLEPHDRRTLWAELVRSFVSPLRIPGQTVLRFDVTDWDRVRMGFAHERAIEKLGGIDLCVLGLGDNGRVAANEPPGYARGVSRCVELSEQARRQHAKDLGFADVDSVPQWAVTLGLGQILGAKERLLLVSGAHQSEILRRCLTETETSLPGHLVAMASQTTIVADRAAASSVIFTEDELLRWFDTGD